MTERESSDAALGTRHSALGTRQGVPAAERRAPSAEHRSVADGLSRPQKELDPKFFYDHRGSELFDEITRLPEYYLTRTERALLERWMPSVLGELRPATLVELGAGSAAKTRLVLDAMRAAGSARVYVPIDVSAEFLDDTAARLRAEYPGLRVTPLVADIAAPISLPPHLPRPIVLAFLGSTIGNFDARAATCLLRRMRGVLGDGDYLLLGADLRKDPATIEAAYNDARGVTAEFNRNMLRVLNHELGADFVPDDFQHYAFYDRALHRIEMHLVSSRPQTVTIPSVGRIYLRGGESIRTEISCKYDRASLDAILDGAGFRTSRWMTDERETYALLLAEPA